MLVFPNVFIHDVFILLDSFVTNTIENNQWHYPIVFNPGKTICQDAGMIHLYNNRELYFRKLTYPHHYSSPIAINGHSIGKYNYEHPDYFVQTFQIQNDDAKTIGNNRIVNVLRKILNINQGLLIFNKQNNDFRFLDLPDLKNAFVSQNGQTILAYSNNIAYLIDNPFEADFD